MSKLTFLLSLFLAMFQFAFAQAPNGFYVGEVCEIDEANVIYYNTPLKIQVNKPLKFVGGHIHSSTNDNDLYRVALKVEKVPENTWLILKIDKSYYATCLRSKRKNKFKSNRKNTKRKYKGGDTAIDTLNSKGGFVVERRSDAHKISKFLKLDIVNRKHFGHQINGEMKARKSVYSLGDSILLDFSITNNGEVPVKLRLDGNWPDYGISSNFRFKVFFKNEEFKDIRSTSTQESYLGEGYVKPPETIHKGDQLNKFVYLNHWYDFIEPGNYTVLWNYRMELINESKPYNRERAPEFIWSDEVKGRLEIVVE